MPAQNPPTGEILSAQLVRIGERIRAHRKQLKVTATNAAEAAGMSRVTLHRIERGEPSVTMGAYMSAVSAVGLELGIADPQDRKPVVIKPRLPARIRLDEYPQLKRLAWQRHDVSKQSKPSEPTELTAGEALNLYERNWRHIDHDGMPSHERALVQALADTLGGGRLLV